MSNTQEVAITAQYLVLGAEDYRRRVGVDNHNLDRVGGHIGMAIELAEWAEVVEGFLAEQTDSDTSWPGVFHYEVTEELGEWLAMRMDGPISVAEFKAELALRFEHFMKQGEPA